MPDWFIYWPVVHFGLCLAFLGWMFWQAGHAPVWDDYRPFDQDRDA